MKNFPSQMTKVESHSLPAGRYFISDPCFSIQNDDDRWDDFLSEVDNGDSTFYFEGSEVFAIGTGGDGSWNHEGETYYVEAGLFAAVPEELVENENGRGVWVDAPDGLEIEVIHDNYGSLRAIRVGEVEVAWYEFDNETIAEFAYDEEDYSVITTPELFAALIDYIDDEQEIADAARAALPQFA